MDSRDRRAKLLGSHTTNGIDFVEVANAAQTELRVHFLNAVKVDPLTAAPTITGGETIPSVAVKPVAPPDWGSDDSHAVLTLHVAAPGDFSIYTLTLPSKALDPFFDHVQFSFKADCPSDLDCAPPAVPCPPLAADAPPIDYLAKDFLSFRQALLDFSTVRYPNWHERSEADFGVMFLEALSALADELSYIQDRIATEASLLTATQRRSVVRHARLVDYEPTPAVSATALLQFEVGRGTTSIPHGLPVIAPAPDGTPVTFETGMGLRDAAQPPANPPPPANPLWNRDAKILAYWFDDSERCLPVKATQMHVLGHGYGFTAGQRLLIETKADNPGDPPIRQIVRLVSADEICDDVFRRAVVAGGPPFLTCPVSPPGADAPTAVTRLSWDPADGLTSARDLAGTTVIGNIAPATQGRTVKDEAFVIGAPTPTIAAAIERTGPRPVLAPGVCGDASAIRLYTLRNAPLAWLSMPDADPAKLPVPEITVTQMPPASSGPAPVTWSWFRRLLDAGPFDSGFTIDAASYRPLEHGVSDYDGDGGDTIRFGDGVFGVNPDTGQFAVTYRYGAGTAGNVAADAICQFDPTGPASGFIAVTNPLPATGGGDPQTLQSVRRLAPQAFGAKRLRAVLGEDYAAAAQTLPWVKRAGTVFRWTGSWLTTFTTPEPVASEQIKINDRIALIDLLNRYRMAGTESYVPDPNYVSVDLIIELCAVPDAFAAQVKQAVLAALSPTGPGAAGAFFAFSRFVFGQPLQRSSLEAALQAVPGVAGVTCIEYRLRNRTQGFAEMGGLVTVGASEIIRCDNDPSRPNNGALTVNVRGGR
jgi:hypothetical protein